MSVSLDPHFASTSAGSTHPAPRAVAAAWRSGLRDIAIACLLAALVLAPTAFELAASWQSSEAYQYAWLVVPMFVYVVGWHHRAALLDALPRPDAAGVVVALVASIGWSLAMAANINIGRQLALIMVLQAIALAALGRALYGRLLPSMAFLFLMLPSGDLLVDPLRQVTTLSIGWFAQALGLPYGVDGYSVRIGDNTYYVLEACSGLAQVTLTFFLGYCYGLLVYRSFLRILALALFSAVLGVLANVIRVCAIVWLDWTRGDMMDLAGHVRIQWLALLVVMAMLFYTLQRLRGDGGAWRLPEAPGGRSPAPGLERYATITAGVVVLLVIGLACAVLGSATVSAAAPPSALPRVAVPVPGWELVTPHAEWSVQGDSRVLALDYRDSIRPGRRLGVTLVETRLAGARMPLPERVTATVQAGWRDIVREPVDACSDGRCVRLVQEVWQDETGRARRYIYYAYSLGGFQTDAKLALRLAVAFSRLSGRNEPARMLAISAEGDAPALHELATIHRAIDDALRDADT